MRIPLDSGTEDAPPPPPYTAYEADEAVTPDYTPSESADSHDLPLRAALRDGYMHRPPSQDSIDSHFSATAAYFEERHFRHDHTGSDLQVLEHHVHFDSGFTPTRLPFPHPPDAYLSRDVTGQDWATFAKSLFPVADNSRKGKSKSGSNGERASTEHIDSPERREKVQAAIAEWNAGFFASRLIRVTAHFEPLSANGSPRSLPAQSAPNGVSNPADLSPFPDTVYHGPVLQNRVVPAYPGSPEKPLRHFGSKSSITSSSSSSSDSSVDSIASKDLDHATLAEIRALIDAFRADPQKKQHLRKSVRELRHHLRTQHLPSSSSDPYNPKASKDEKKAFKEQRKALRKEIKAVVKEAKDECKADRKHKKALRKIRKDTRKQERREIKQCRREEKHARRDEKRSTRELKRSQKHCGGLQPLSTPLAYQQPNQNDPASQTHPILSQDRAAHNRTASWSSDRVAQATAAAQSRVQIARARSNEAVEAARTRSAEAVEAARQRADIARETARQRADAVRQSARLVGQQARDRAADAGRRGSNVAANAKSWSSEQAASAAEIARRPFESGRRGSGKGPVGDAGGAPDVEELAATDARIRGPEQEPVELRAQTTGMGDQKVGVVG